LEKPRKNKGHKKSGDWREGGSRGGSEEREARGEGG